MSEIEMPPPCHRCGAPQWEHDFYEAGACDFYIWPGTIHAASLDLEKALRELWQAILPKRFRS